MVKRKVILFGASGHLGNYLNKTLINNNFSVKTPSRIEVNEILNNKYKKEFFEDSFVINTVAIVGKENSNSCLIDDLKLINEEFPKKLSEGVNLYNSKLIHISSNSVFDNSKKHFRRDKDTPSSKTNYGISKINAEINIKETLNNKKYIILRTPQHYSNDIDNPRNLLCGIYKQLKKYKHIKITRNETFSIASCQRISLLIVQLIEKDFYGLYHVSELKNFNWFEIARILSKKMGLNWRESISNVYNDKLQINNTLYPSSDTILESDIIKKDFLQFNLLK
ncbi:putative dTDP-4-dehydrorhamnose reductase [Prochlorococcus marinus subsp. pastoris str. CCMP1986]|uniref:dTDP-4-dehydrorhamnose reductase n=1 Tax=Prochlorococcus marinus subsp. pastoris (strain CCMP1986 / NIES-2087 / MED4) TaxID=59919 RepID=Q7V0M3_PROMP|nr:sugar nucleotide-binding protein [Prochlorococcus marinus]KGF87204.1 dTDP-4-dehydrorhamnose reductase [Prochlorococcus marinus str. EQPAC1]CAE19692.1 putative dTDP-4-dehydrorhamnose reductase [Prochlorococcus marinus subsp. pastoris str. CCMP1986]